MLNKMFFFLNLKARKSFKSSTSKLKGRSSQKNTVTILKCYIQNNSITLFEYFLFKLTHFATKFSEIIISSRTAGSTLQR
jgi:hypothetical protein